MMRTHLPVYGRIGTCSEGRECQHVVSAAAQIQLLPFVQINVPACLQKGALCTTHKKPV